MNDWPEATNFYCSIDTQLSKQALAHHFAAQGLILARKLDSCTL
ncbi:hypothetical protein [Agitococcus lubricus]|uniref:Uncharacterized protein n=1 Tax=Agitococcus lubricus TaxID=1077255 RepID=A0A2T5IYW6_9GAMM|nr:hypothetical protein [Agitococcus lubricus]PTQ89102.1 hypothetical protein C8N29_109125 [Agitococcus lubricus]